MANKNNHIVPYRTYVYVLLILLFLTATSVIVTNIELGTLTVTTALVLASLKSILVFAIFMHLKFDQPVYGIMTGGVIILIIIVILITFLDYFFR
ncbi:MAG: cytochrome C oxidase subunit IV family protein [Bacteroidales bacterium]|nr:MAG: cytochrome C oxidase subunit IV family protein [Bacteroidales bacterium]